MFIDFGLIAGMSFVAIVIFLLVKLKSDFSKKLLIIIFANVFFFLLYHYGYLHRSRPVGGIAVLFGNGTGYLLGPTILTILKSFFISKEKLVRPYVRSLIPYFIFFLIINVPYFLAMVFGVFRPYQKFMVSYEYITISLENLYFLYYLLVTKKVYFRLKAIFEENYSTQEMDSLKWFNYLISGLIFIVIADNICTIYELMFPMVPWNIGTIVAFIFIGMCFYLGYKGIFQSRILIPELLIEKFANARKEISFPSNRDENRHLDEKMSIRQLDVFSESEIENLKNKLVNLLEDEKVYLDEEINLTELSSKIGISNKKLSELINHHFNTNFYNLINEYRINEVRKRFDKGDADKYTITSIAYDSGFQSKASFYRIFKQKAGVSPSEYIKQLHKAK